VKLSEFKVVNEGWGDALQSVASGFVKGATGIDLSNKSNLMNKFSQDFVRRIDPMLRQAISSKNVSTDPVQADRPDDKPWTWRPSPSPALAGSGFFRSGNTKMVYQRTPSTTGAASWKKLAGSGRSAMDYGTDTSQAMALEKKWQEYQRDVKDTAAGAMRDLSENYFNKLNKIFENIMSLNEAPPPPPARVQQSISAFLMKAVGQFLGGSVFNLTTDETKKIKDQTIVVQKSYKNPSDYIKQLTKLGDILYPMVKARNA
jgi:hypothetical protein